MRGPIPFQMLAHAYQEVSGCLLDVTGITGSKDCISILDTASVRLQLKITYLFGKVHTQQFH